MPDMMHEAFTHRAPGRCRGGLCVLLLAAAPGCVDGSAGQQHSQACPGRDRSFLPM